MRMQGEETVYAEKSKVGKICLFNVGLALVNGDEKWLDWTRAQSYAMIELHDMGDGLNAMG